MSTLNGLFYWNRYSQNKERELVYGDKAIRALYETKSGRAISNLLAIKPLSKIYGSFQSTSLSQRKIDPFIVRFQINMDEYEPGPFKSFNEFFTRRFKKERRPFTQSPKEMAAFCEGRYLGFKEVHSDGLYPVKGTFLSAKAILGHGIAADKDISTFENGPMLIGRLCPTDYHRFHFFDDGSVTDSWRVPGQFHSVNPVALKARGDIFKTNERFVTLLRTKNFGKVAFVEVGAMMVGKIVQTHTPDQPFHRGDEKGYFLFGASTVIVIGEKGAWQPDDDILSNTSEGLETFIRLGDHVAVSQIT